MTIYVICDWIIQYTIIQLFCLNNSPSPELIIHSFFCLLNVLGTYHKFISKLCLKSLHLFSILFNIVLSVLSPLDFSFLQPFTHPPALHSLHLHSAHVSAWVFFPRCSGASLCLSSGLGHAFPGSYVFLGANLLPCCSGAGPTQELQEWGNPVL